jgi:cytochrome c biogenesis protein CcmG/thiol:disulfide interchange protein DsbE
MKKIFMAILLTGLAATGCTAAPQQQGSRQTAPDFNLKTLDGKTLQLSALKGKVVLLDFWATWCPPCKAEIPHFKELYDQYRGKGLEIIGVALDEGGEKDVAPFAQQNQINYPLAAAGAQQLAQAYGGVRGIPTTFLIDKQGKIAKKYVGYQDKQVFEKEIQALLAE